MQEPERLRQAAAAVQGRMPAGFRPRVGLTLGTGLSGLASKIQVKARVPYAEIPGLPVSTVQSHQGELVLGSLGGVAVAALAGRFHLYEGYSPLEVVRGVRLLAELGVEAMVFTCAAGGLDPAMQAGRVMLIKDHINLTGQNPLTGPNFDAWGERFPDMSQPYDPGLLALARRAAQDQKITLYEGVYVGLRGPSMETPAETRMLRILGADAVGMSTVLEVIAARHRGLKVLACAAISNVNIPEDMQPAPIELVIENASKAGAGLEAIIAGVLAGMQGQ
ncbi:MAG: purine-nucleoside phosphorylase [Desulfarculus sp.]|nr:purine-nucleoside phosphorylase [Desulfarculus sp.]